MKPKVFEFERDACKGKVELRWPKWWQFWEPIVVTVTGSVYRKDLQKKVRPLCRGRKIKIVLNDLSLIIYPKGWPPMHPNCRCAKEN